MRSIVISRISALAALALLAGCAAPDHYVPEPGDALQAPRQNETLGEALHREQQAGGCLVAGNISRKGCDGLEAVLEPPSLGDRIEPPPEPTASAVFLNPAARTSARKRSFDL